jgi:hypothetical protein
MSVRLLTANRPLSTGQQVTHEPKSIKSEPRIRKNSQSEKASYAPQVNDSAAVLDNQEAALTFLHETSITYDPAELPKIQPYLLSADIEVQKAAVDAMVVLGDAAAAPMLREASRQTMDTDMVMEMLKAADYLELPPADVKIMAALLKKNSSTGNKTKDRGPGRHAINAKEREKRMGAPGRQADPEPKNTD